MQRFERRFSWAQARRGTISPSSRQWTASDSNREPPGCRPGALPVGASSPCGCPRRTRAPAVPQALSGLTYFRPGWPVSFMVFRCGIVNAQARSPIGGASQGWRESNTHSAGFGDRTPSRWVIPTHMKSRPSGFPASGSWPELAVPIQKPPGSPGCRSVARTQACRHAFRLADNRPTRDSRVFLPSGVLLVINSSCGRWVAQRLISGHKLLRPALGVGHDRRTEKVRLPDRAGGARIRQGGPSPCGGSHGSPPREHQHSHRASTPIGPDNPRRTTPEWLGRCCRRLRRDPDDRAMSRPDD